MNTSPLPLNRQRPHWQDDKHLHSEDRIWILTDVRTYSSRFMECSPEQTLYKVGVYDLNTDHVGFAIFGRDIAHAMIKAGVQPPPWKEPLRFGIELHRDAHANGEERGRFTGWVELITLDPELVKVLPVALKKFADHRPNSTPGMLDDLVARAQKENAIEAAALSMVGLFSAGDVRDKIGDPNADVTPVLRRLVRQGKLLPPVGKKRWTRYQVASPSISIRVDWTG